MIDVIAISAVNETNLGAVKQYLKPGKTVVFLGSSGVVSDNQENSENKN